MAKPAKRWTTLRELRPGAVFETREGIKAVKSEYRCSHQNLQFLCILLESGKYVHFPIKNATEVRQIFV